MLARALAAVALVCLLARAGSAQPARDSDQEDAAARALRDWGLGHDDLSRDDALNYAVTLVSDAVGKRDGGVPIAR